MEELIVY